MLAALPCLLLAAAPAAQNPYLAAARALYRGLEFEEALKQVEAGQRWPQNDLADDVQLALLEGLLAFELEQPDRSLLAFKRALALEPTASIDASASPKVRAHFELARRQLPAVAPPTVELPVTPEPPQKREAQLAVAGVASGDLLGPAWAGGLFLSASRGRFEVRAYGRFGGPVGVDLELLVALYRGDRLRPALGLRGAAVPTASAYGGGPVAALDVLLVGPLFAHAEVAALFLAAPAPYRNFAVAASLGLGVRFSFSDD